MSALRQQRPFYKRSLCEQAVASLRCRTWEPNFGYRLLRAIYPAFRVLFPNQVIRADDLARAMVDVALRGTGERRTLVFENRDIRAIVDSIHSLPSSPAED